MRNLYQVRWGKKSFILFLVIKSIVNTINYSWGILQSKFYTCFLTFFLTYLRLNEVF